MNCCCCEDVAMMGYTVGGVGLDVCPGCKGFWFDGGELEKVLRMPERRIQESFTSSGIASGQFGHKGDDRRCPRCSEGMEKERCEAIWVDYCTKGCGVWLDAGELQLIYQNAARARGPLPPGTQTPKGGALTDFVDLTVGVLAGPLGSLWRRLTARR